MLAKIASKETRNEEGIPVEELSIPEETCLIQPLQPAPVDWVKEMVEFIQQGTLPGDPTRAR